MRWNYQNHSLPNMIVGYSIIYWCWSYNPSPPPPRSWGSPTLKSWVSVFAMLLAPYPNTTTDENYGFCSNNQNIKYTLTINEFGYGVARLTYQLYLFIGSVRRIETMHQLLRLKSKFPNHFAFTLGHYLFLLFWVQWIWCGC
jgi:hypothetical protein